MNSSDCAEAFRAPPHLDSVMSNSHRSGYDRVIQILSRLSQSTFTITSLMERSR